MGVTNESHIFEPTSIDTAIKMWFSEDLQTRYGIDVNIYSNALACGCGQFMVDKLGMEWRVITDNFGTEIGLFHSNHSTTIFPFKSTAKAFTTRSFGLITTITSKTREVNGMK